MGLLGLGPVCSGPLVALAKILPQEADIFSIIESDSSKFE